MSVPWSNKGEKTNLVNADEFMILDSEDATPTTKNKRVSRFNVLSSVPTSRLVDFTNFDAVFKGEVGIPSDNVPPWTEITPTKITLEDEIVFGITRQVVKFDQTVAAGGSAGTQITLNSGTPGDDWDNIENFGASYSGIMRMNTGNPAIFMGLENATQNKRYGLFTGNNGGFLQINQTDGGALNVTFDGSIPGLPVILFDEYFKLEIVVPSGLGDADVFVNEILLPQQLQFRTNTGGGGDRCVISSGSSTANNRVFFVSNYGVIIYESSNTKILTTADMESNSILILIPPGKRDYSILLPSIPRAQADSIRLLAENVLGTVTLSSSPLNSDILFKGLRTLVLDIKSVFLTPFVNTIDNANNYELESEVIFLTDFKGESTIQGDITKDVLIGTLQKNDTDTKLQVTDGLSVDGNIITPADHSGLTLPISKLSIGAVNTTFDVSAGRGIIINREPGVKPIILEIPEQLAIVDPNLLDPTTHVFIESNGTLSVRSTPPTTLNDIHDTLYLGFLIHTGGVITDVIDAPIVASGSSSTEMEKNVIGGGTRTQGALLSPTSTLAFNVNIGVLNQYGRGTAGTSNINSPNHVLTPFEAPIPIPRFSKVFIDGVGALIQDRTTNLLDPTLFNEDGLGVLQPVPNNMFTVFHVFLEAITNDVYWYYGTDSYTNPDDALNAEENGFTEHFSTRNFSPIALVAIKENVIDGSAAFAGNNVKIRVISRRP